MKKLLALCLALCILLSGCAFVDFSGYLQGLGALFGSRNNTPFSDMVYNRPDMPQLEKTLADCLDTAAGNNDLSTVLEAIYRFNKAFSSFSTAYALANIHYSLDLTDENWAAEYDFCTAQVAAMDATLDRFYRTLAKSDLREALEDEQYFGAGFFDDYTGQSVYSEAFQALLTEEAALESEYYAVMARLQESAAVTGSVDETYYADLSALYIDLIRVRKALAREAGFDNYPDFAYSFHYGRDYSCAQVQTLMARIREDLSPIYMRLMASDYLDTAYFAVPQGQVFSWLQQAANAMGGVVQEAFTRMDRGGLYDLSDSPVKFSNSFEIYLPDYSAPYIFFSPTGTNYDQLAFAHEFGHFCSDYASAGSQAGIDVAEVFSQGMEYMALCYAKDPALERLKMAGSLQVFVEQTAYADFEQQVYTLPEEALTRSHLAQLYGEVLAGYGIPAELVAPEEYLLVPHFFVSPMYVISYVVSNHLAMQLYLLEKEKPGVGLQCLTDGMPTMESGIQAFAQETEVLLSPLAPGSLEEIRQLLLQYFA